MTARGVAGFLMAAGVLTGCAGDDARPARGSAGVLSVAEGATASAEPWTFQGNRGTAYATEHYRLLTTIKRPILRDRMPGFNEASLARFRETFPGLPEPRKGMETFVLDSRPEWSRFVAEVFGPTGVDRYRGIERGGFTERGRSVLWNMGVQDTFAIMAHEGWHQYAQSTLREPLPAWLDEGLAVWAEGFRWDPLNPSRAVFLPWANVERFDRLRAAAGEGSLMPLGQLLTERPQELIRVSADSTLTYYAECWALVHYLLDDPDRRDALERMLADAASGQMGARVRERFGDRAVRSIALRRSGIEIWQRYLGGDLAAQEQEFAAYLAEITRPGAKGRVVEGRSPRD